MTKQEIKQQIIDKQSMLCVGLDTDIRRIPQFIIDNYEDPIVEFNRQIIEATHKLAVAYKFNIAFYESLGSAGWESLERSLALIPEGLFTIADAKRGDIGNTSALYARTFFETFDFDAITVTPYMGRDSIEPFYQYDDKWVIVLGLTSNKGSHDFQHLSLANGGKLYQHVLSICASYGNSDNTMFVIGATNTDQIKEIREQLPDHFFLMPGIGSQGGNLKNALKYGINEDYGLLINSSRGIIYAGHHEHFQFDAAAEALKLQRVMSNFIKE